MQENQRFADKATANAIRRPEIAEDYKPQGFFKVECRDKNGKLKWVEEFHNLVTNVGKDYALDTSLNGGTPITTWYLGLTSATPTPAAADTMASHGGWTENQNYTESVRQTLTLGTVSGQSVNNSASPASFSINTNAQSIGGVFLASDSTKGGTTGTLYSIGAFSGGNKAADNGDTLNVTYTASAS